MGGRQRDRQTDRQTDRQIDRQTDRHTATQRDRTTSTTWSFKGPSQVFERRSKDFNHTCCLATAASQVLCCNRCLQLLCCNSCFATGHVPKKSKIFKHMKK